MSQRIVPALQKQTFEIHSQNYQLLLSGFDKMIKAVGYKQGNMYTAGTREFLNYMESKGILQIKKIQAVDMVAFYEYISKRSNMRSTGLLSNSQISNIMFSVNLFSDYLLQHEYINTAFMFPKHINKKGKERNILTLEEIKTLYAQVQNKRDVAILSIAYGCGLRRTEIESLNVADVQLSSGMLIVREGKNTKRREIPLSDNIVTDLKDYLINERHVYFKDNGMVRTEAFLVNNKGKRMMGDHINDRLKELIEKTNDQEILNKAITLHCLRHSIATHLLDNGANIEFVRDFLGHVEIDTAHIYAKRRKIKEKYYTV